MNSHESAMSMQAFAQRFGFEGIALEQWPAHLPVAVEQSLPRDGVLVFACADEYSDTAAFCAHHGCGLADCANTLVLKFSKNQGEHFAAVVSLGSRRLDINGAVKQRLEAKRLSLAKREVATDITGMEFGGITAFGLPTGMRILVDAAVMERPCVVMGAGHRRSKLLLAPKLLAALPSVEVAALTFAHA